MSTYGLKNALPAFHDAYTLLRVWANQRGYGDGELCVKGFEGKGLFWAGLLHYLISGEELVGTKSGGAKLRRPLGKGLSSYQLFKAVLDFLGKPFALPFTRLADREFSKPEVRRDCGVHKDD